MHLRNRTMTGACSLSNSSVAPPSRLLPVTVTPSSFRRPTEIRLTACCHQRLLVDSDGPPQRGRSSAVALLRPGRRPFVGFQQLLSSERLQVLHYQDVASTNAQVFPADQLIPSSLDFSKRMTLSDTQSRAAHEPASPASSRYSAKRGPPPKTHSMEAQTAKLNYSGVSTGLLSACMRHSSVMPQAAGNQQY